MGGEAFVGQISDVRWSWESKDGDIRVGYARIDGGVSIAELIACMRDMAPGAGLDDVEVNFATVKWKRPATVEELAEREQRNERQRVRQEKWERETLERLTEKYAQTAAYLRGMATDPNACNAREPHGPHEHYGSPAALRRDCPGRERDAR